MVGKFSTLVLPVETSDCTCFAETLRFVQIGDGRATFKIRSCAPDGKAHASRAGIETYDGFGDLAHQVDPVVRRDQVQLNVFTSAFKELEPIPQLRATATLGRFLEVT